jgi:flagellar biosynthesis protein FliQ
MSPYIQLAGEALWLIILLSLPPLLVSLAVGLLVSFLQALTQIQEQTLTFVPKIITTVLVILISAGWMLSHLMVFTKKVFDLIPTVGTHL